MPLLALFYCADINSDNKMKKSRLGLRPDLHKIGCTSAIQASLIALTYVDLERDSAMHEQAHIALAALSVRFALSFSPPGDSVPKYAAGVRPNF